VNPELEVGVVFVQRALRLALAMRNASGLRVRQPVASVLVLAPARALTWLREFDLDLREELNAEAVEVEPLDAAVAHALRADGHASWPSPRGTPIALAVDAGPFRAALDGDLVVAVDTRLTPALRRKGLARQLAHEIQRLRKTMGFRVDDRIRLSVVSDPERQAAIAEHAEHLRAETLAVEFAVGPPPTGWAVHILKLDGGQVTVGIARASEASLPCYDSARPVPPIEEN
jgi:isoleucyl-tRNA synthetase